ncbi:MAG: NADP-dependent malic enzyme [Rubrivivax sp.]|nr:NADP-dependent malic enzyme [Rubrivivax sp.]
MPQSESKRVELRQAALEYHEFPTPGKIAISATKQLVNQRDLALAYSPGVAAACEEIAADPANAFRYTSRGNLVAVVTNGTAVLGLGNIGPLASKPVMEGKAVMFKKFAGIDVFDIEVDENDLDKLVEHIAALEPTLGGINLEDIKAPECFYVEKKLKERLSIPVFHDDQHGTAIISGAALLNALELVGKQLGDIKLVCSGAGAAAIACLDVMVGLGVNRNNVYVLDSKGVIQSQREDALSGKLDESKQRYCQITAARTLADAMQDADVFLGCSTAGVLKPEMVTTMARQPIILALANPEPEIRPELAKQARPDCIVATGRSDYPNQVNNVLCFPYIFRGALDCGATKITEAMKLACVREIAALAKAEASDEVAAAYQGKDLRFGPDYIIPTPFDVRLILRIAPAVARAAAESGVATRPITDYDAYQLNLSRFVYQTGMFMRPVFESAAAFNRQRSARVVFAEGEDERVLRAVQVVLDEGLARPVLVGRPEVVKMRVARAGLRLEVGRDFELCDPEHDPRFRSYWELYRSLKAREGVTPEVAKATVRRSNTLIASLMLRRGEADALICGLVGRYDAHLEHLRDVIGGKPGVRTMAAMNALMLDQHTLFIADTFVNEEPTAEELADIAQMAAAEVRRFGMPPKLAFLSHSIFGSSQRASAQRMRAAHALFAARSPEIECDGEMHGDAALNESVRRGYLPETTLTGSANLLVLPNLDAANILFNVLKATAGHGVTVGPILLGARKPAHILTPSATVRRIVNMTALAVADAAEAAQTGRAAF